MSHDTATGDRLTEESRAEQARMTADLDALNARVVAADDAQQRTVERVRSTFFDMTHSARAELAALEAAHVDAVAALRARAEADVRSVSDGDPPEGV